MECVHFYFIDLNESRFIVDFHLNGIYSMELIRRRRSSLVPSIHLFVCMEWLQLSLKMAEQTFDFANFLRTIFVRSITMDALGKNVFHTSFQFLMLNRNDKAIDKENMKIYQPVVNVHTRCVHEMHMSDE